MLFVNLADFPQELLSLLLFAAWTAIHIVLVAVWKVETDLTSTVARYKRTACTVSHCLIQVNRINTSKWSWQCRVAKILLHHTLLSLSILQESSLLFEFFETDVEIILFYYGIQLNGFSFFNRAELSKFFSFTVAKLNFFCRFSSLLPTTVIVGSKKIYKKKWMQEIHKPKSLV